VIDHRALLELTKPRITALVTFTAAVAYVTASGGEPETLRLAALVVGTALSAGGTNGLNQWWEREADARMDRTGDRPLPSGRLAPRTALLFTAGLALLGVVLLWAVVGPVTGALAAATVALYVLVYTPLKKVHAACTYVGAVPGALPVLGGWAAAGGPFDAPAWGLFGILVLWQLPHFFALEWLLREDYRRAGFRTLAVADPSGGRSARHAVAATAALLPASLLPLADPGLGPAYGIATAAGFVVLLVAAVGFLVGRRARWAHRLFTASLVHLPLVLVVTALDVLT
jgi:protoheme IX farnesyltransferase